MPRYFFAAIDLGIISVLGLLIFVGMFIVIVIWAASRKQSQIDRWSKIPLTSKIMEPTALAKSEAQKAKESN